MSFNHFRKQSNNVGTIKRSAIFCEMVKMVDIISYLVQKTDSSMNWKQHNKYHCFQCVFQLLSQAIQQCENHQLHLSHFTIRIIPKNCKPNLEVSIVFTIELASGLFCGSKLQQSRASTKIESSFEKKQKKGSSSVISQMCFPFSKTFKLDRIRRMITYTLMKAFKSFFHTPKL